MDAGTLHRAPCVPSISMHNRIASPTLITLAPDCIRPLRYLHAPNGVARRVQTPHASPRVAMASKTTRQDSAQSLQTRMRSHEGLGELSRVTCQVPHLARRSHFGCGPPSPRAVGMASHPVANRRPCMLRLTAKTKHLTREYHNKLGDPKTYCGCAYVSASGLGATLPGPPVCLCACVPATCSIPIAYTPLTVSHSCKQDGR